jgi:hypothetical protein
MLGNLVGYVLAGVLVLAAGLKAAKPRAAQDALTTFGLRRPAARRSAWAAAIVAEAGLGAGVALGSAVAAYLAAALLIGYAAALTVALAHGHGGAPCGCFGARSRVGRGAVARSLALAAALAAVPALRTVDPSTDGWLGLGLGAASLGLAVLGVGVLALAREVGELRLRLGSDAALEIPEEGPTLGTRSEVISSFAPGPHARLAAAIFSSDGCPVCRTLEPAVAYVARDPLVALRVFDEHRDHDVWQRLAVPGSPYAVALGLDGTVLAKGTFNTLDQLEGVLAAAERREGEAVGA